MSTKPFRIAMIPTSTDGVNYYRLAAWAFEMRKYRNVEVALLWFKYNIDGSRPHPWQEDFNSTETSGNEPNWTVGQYIRACIDRACEWADVVVWHPVHYDHIYDFFLEMKHKHEKPFIVDADDNFVDVPEWNEAFHSFKQGSSFRRVALECLQTADSVFVTTPHLKDLYSRFNEKVYVMENSLDFKGDRKFVGWDKPSVKKHQGTRIGWIGGRAHFGDLMMVAPALREILDKNPNVRLTLVNSAFKMSCHLLGRPYPFEGLKTVTIADRSVAINRYAAFMASFGFDIGIAPLVDCNFNRSKSNLRWLEYSALQIPCVASSVGHFAQTIRHGEDGLLIENNDQKSWVDRLQRLIGDFAYRESVGRNAHRRVKSDFNIKHNASRYIRHLKQISNFNTELPEEEEMAVAV